MKKLIAIIKNNPLIYSLLLLVVVLFVAVINTPNQNSDKNGNHDTKSAHSSQEMGISLAEVLAVTDTGDDAKNSDPQVISQKPQAEQQHTTTFTITWDGTETSLNGAKLTPDTEDTLGDELFSIIPQTTEYDKTIVLTQEEGGSTSVNLRALTFSNPEITTAINDTIYKIQYISSTMEVPNGLIAFNDYQDSYALNADFNNNHNSGAQYSSLNIISRDTWGANTSSWDPHSSLDIDDPDRLSWPPYYYGFSRIVVHHTATTNNYTDGAKQVRDIYLYHAYSRGWGDLGYNYLIDKYGNIYEGKNGGDGVFSYHAYGPANRMAMSVSLIGDFTNQAPTSAALNSLEKLIAEKAILYGIPRLTYSNGALSKWLNPSYTVFGHRDSFFYCSVSHPLNYLCGDGDYWHVNATACPGNSFWPILSTVTSSAEAFRLDQTKFSEVRKVSSDVESSFEATDFEGNSFKVVFDLPETVDEQSVLNLIPDFSGISYVEVDGNSAEIYVYDWANGGFVPELGYTGPSTEPNSFFPSGSGPTGRVKLLLKLFRLRDDVISADVDTEYVLHGQ